MASMRSPKGLALPRLAWFTAAGALLLLALPRAASAEPAPDPASWLFAPTLVARIDLTLPPASIAALEAEPDEYQPGTFSLHGVGGEFGPLDVGIRLKGGVGSFRPLDREGRLQGQVRRVRRRPDAARPGEADPQQHGPGPLDDPRDPGLRSVSRGRRAGLEDGLRLRRPQRRGLRPLPERRDPRQGLAAALFASTKHLYEAEYATDVVPGGAAAFEVDEGKKSERGDLEALIAAANGESGDWSDGVAPFADLGEMTSAWAVERYIGHWDGYAGRILPTTPNNYYLHSDASGLFTMLPWGTDQTWDERLPFDAEGGLLFNRCLGDESCAALYREAVAPGAGLDRRPRPARAASTSRRRDQALAGRRPASRADDETGRYRGRPGPRVRRAQARGRRRLAR